MPLNYVISFKTDEETYRLWLQIQMYAKYRKLRVSQVGSEMIRDYWMKIRPILERITSR